MANNIPKIKKKISSYIKNEDGKISKQALMALGALLSSAAVGTVLKAKSAEAARSPLGQHLDHGNNLALRYDSGSSTATGEHEHHVSHTSY